MERLLRFALNGARSDTAAHAGTVLAGLLDRRGDRAAAEEARRRAARAAQH